MWACRTFMELKAKSDRGEGPKPTYDMVYKRGIAEEQWSAVTRPNTVGQWIRGTALEDGAPEMQPPGIALQDGEVEESSPHQDSAGDQDGSSPSGA